MRLLLYAPVFVRPSETFIYDLATELASAGVDVSVVTSRRELAEECPFEPVTVVPKPGRWSPDRLARRVYGGILGRYGGRDASTAAHRARIGATLKGARPDIILAEYGESGVLLARLARAINVPLVVSFHGADATRAARGPFWRSHYASMLPLVAAATGPSAYIRDKLIDLGCPPDRAHVIHNGVRLNRIPFTSPVDRYTGGEIRFLFVGRLTEKKDPISLLRSFARARSALTDKQLTLTIVGDGPLRHDVEREIRSLQLEESVRLLGRQPHSRVIELFGTSHIYVQHSVTAMDGDEEGLPVSITEALASGLPVISTRHSGIPEIVRHGETGLLVAEGDVAGMAQAIIDLAHNPESWQGYGEAGRTVLEEEFAMPVVQRRLRSFLQSICEQHS